MKNGLNLFSKLFLVILFFANSFVFGQLNWSAGANVGYGSLSMSNVNDVINGSYDNIVNGGFSNYSVEKEEVAPGLYFDGGVYVELSKLITGLTVNYISGEGYVKGEVNNVKHEINFNMSTVEIMGMAGTSLPLAPTIDLILRGYVGVGIPSAEITDGIGGKWEGTGPHFAAKGQVGVEFDLQVLLLTAGISYRYSNAGELKGDATAADGTSVSDKNALYKGKNIEFDYSGAVLSAGVRVPF